ncbi:MAG: heparinase II/III family protein [Gemmatimonadota bacterium]
MTLLLTGAEFSTRRGVAMTAFAPLVDGLREELAPLIDALPEVPREKALLSRTGGRCTLDGSLLVFDPHDPRHFCALCGQEYAGGLHDRFRLYWYQLWLAERVLHAALLGALTGERQCVVSATSLLDQYADQYLRYPNADNVLGPSRPFFSTYLESIWLLQLSIAMDLLEIGVPSPEMASLGAKVRDRLVAPSAALIESYDEGMSNRQVWNNAALLAAARLLDDRVRFDRILHARSGLHAQLEHALLSDGSWYEGENYHLFAHRGLWYATRLARTAGHELPKALADRMHEGFVSPFRTILPDLTYPARRDSQYAISVRQPRFAESCELGLAARDDDRLTSMLARLYDPSVPRGDTGRDSTSADVERNLPGTGLRREDLSWRTLLFARPSLPPLVARPLESDLLPAQGLAVIRRNEGRLYVSLDYGHSGGGHGHPDRLNLTLMDGAHRWFDDPGTGSYVDASLHWYRSTLAHNAPLLDGHSQPRVHGELIAWHVQPRGAWVSAHVELAPGCMVERTVVVLDDYLVDDLRWSGDAVHEVMLPIHGVLPTERRRFMPTPPPVGAAAEDGFSFLRHLTKIDATPDKPIGFLGKAEDGASIHGIGIGSHPTMLWTALAPDAPGRDRRVPLTLVRHQSADGRFVTVWSWNNAVSSFERDGDALIVHRTDGTRDRHLRASKSWLVELADGAAGIVELRGEVERPATTSQALPQREPFAAPIALPAHFALGEPHYRRSEFTWQGAGGPVATVDIIHPAPGTVRVLVDVPTSQRLFVPITTENQLDNEPASINGDSVQLYALAGGRSAGLLLVPNGGAVDQRPVSGWANDLVVDATWRALSSGYHLEATLYFSGAVTDLAIDVVINDVVSGRARRRGQLVLSGAHGEFVYLRGDRHDPSCLLHLSLPNA